MGYEIGERIEFDSKNYEVIGDTKLEDNVRKKSQFWAGALSILLFAVVAAGGFFAIRWIYPPMCFPITIWSFVMLIGGYIVYLFVHELLRGLLLLLPGGVRAKDLLFGVVLNRGTVYCVSKAPVKLRRMRLTLLVAFFVVFVPLAVLGMYYADMVLILGAALAISVSASDFYYMHRLRGHKGSLYLLERRPDKINDDIGGYIVKEEVTLGAIEKE